MRKSLLLTFLLTASLPLLAKDRTPAEIRSIALQTLQHAEGLNTRRAQSLTAGDLKVLHADQSLTVMGRADGQGFVIVTNNDDFQPVIGYADGSFSTDTNHGLAWFVETASRCIEAAQADGSARRAPVVPTTPPVEPLLTSVWNQGAPFNTLCPYEANGTHYPCGCVATALGQIMYYHKYPQQGRGSKQYSFKPADGVGQLLSANFGETTYDWANMIDNYEGNYTEEQGNAVAQMVLHCGVSVEMNYTPTGSGAYSSEARNGLINYFTYNENLGLFYRDYYSMEAWMDMIFTELNNGRPIYYAGADASRGGHAFVFDGYDANGLVHVNWGWGSKGGNGYYDISLLNPPGYSFSQGQDMILGIAKPTEAIEYQSHVVSANAFSANVSKVGASYYLTGTDVGTSLWNICGYAWAGSLGIVMENDEHTYVLQERTVSTTAHRYNTLSNISESFKAAIKIPNDVADGTYHIFVGSKDEHDKKWQLVRRSGGQANSIVVEVKDGAVTSNGATSNDTWVPTAISDVRVSAESDAPARYYDLQGRQVDASTRGLVIMRQGNSVKKVVR